MKRTATRILAVLSMTALFAQSAMADTYILLMNTLEGPVVINGSDSVESRGGIWSPLDATILHSGNKTARIKDMHRQCSGGGWLIQATATGTTDLCLQLGFGEIGCVLAILSKDGSGYKIEMEKVRNTACSDQWFNTKGKSIFYEAYDLYTKQTRLAQDGAKAAAEFISAIK